MRQIIGCSDFRIIRFLDVIFGRTRCVLTFFETHGRALLVAELVEVKKHSMNVSIAKRRTKFSILNFQLP